MTPNFHYHRCVAQLRADEPAWEHARSAPT
jgi:hypothetical protein